MLISLKVGINENTAGMTTSVMTLLPNVIEIIQMGQETPDSTVFTCLQMRLSRFSFVHPGIHNVFEI
jgi:hypothetical protein